MKMPKAWPVLASAGIGDRPRFPGFCYALAENRNGKPGSVVPNSQTTSSSRKSPNPSTLSRCTRVLPTKNNVRREMEKWGQTMVYCSRFTCPINSQKQKTVVCPQFSETYDDHTLPQSQIAFVEGYWHYRFIYDEELQIVSVDGKREAERSGWPYAYSISLPSGRHWIQLAVLRNSGEIARCAFEETFESSIVTN